MIGQIAAHVGGPASAAILLYYLLRQDIADVGDQVDVLSTRMGEQQAQIVTIGVEVRDLGRRLDRIEAQPPQQPVTPPRR